MDIRELLKEPIDNVLKMATNSLANNEWADVFENHLVARNKREDIIVRVVSEDTSVRDQGDSGRCWIFTTLSFYRSILVNKSTPRLCEDSVILSASYLFFWHLLESSASFMEKIRDHASEKITDPVNTFLLSNPVSDGASNTTGHLLISRYGIVPESVMPDTAQTENTESLRKFISKILRSAAFYIRRDYLKKGAFKKHQSRFLKMIWRVLVASLGEPPGKFSYSFEQCEKDKFLTVTDLAVLSVDIEKLLEAMRESLKAKIPVFTGTDVLNDFSEDLGWADINLYDPESILKSEDIQFLKKIPKDELVNFGIYQPNHAMLVIGYGTENHKPDGKITHWLLENSWGNESGDDGLVYVSNEWMLRNLYIAVIQEQFLPKEYETRPSEKDLIEFEVFEGIPDLLE